MFRWLFVRHSSVQQKLLISFLALIVLPLGIFAYTSLTITRQTIEQQAGEAKLKSLGLVSQKLDIMASDLEAISNIYFSNDELRTLLLSPSGNPVYQDRLKKQFLTNLIVSYRYAYTWLEYYTSIFGYNGTELHTFYGGNKIGVDALRQEPWFQKVDEENGGIVWLTNPSPRLKPTLDDDFYISAVRLLKNFETNTSIGFMMINVGEGFIYKQYADAAQPNERLLLFDQDGIIVSAKDKALLGQSLKAAPYYPEFTGGEGHFIDHSSGQATLVTYHRVQSTGWTVVSFTPLDSLLLNVRKSSWLTIVLLGSLVVLSVVVSYFIARRLSVPIRSLFTSMKKVELGDLSVRSPIRGTDEIGELAMKFNRMVGRIEELRDRVILEQENKRKTELQNLQSQINTHFLYNTLASIRSMLLTEPAHKIDSVIVSLVRLLRRTLSDESEYIPIAEELDNLKHYINIQQARQGDKLSVQFNVDEQMVMHRTLKLLLQPIVENAIFHGIEPKIGPGHITIDGWMEEDKLWFRVSDDGVGRQASGKIDGAQTNRSFPESGGMGLRNVESRLKAHFGNRCGLELRERAGGGTEVNLHWPVGI